MASAVDEPRIVWDAAHKQVPSSLEDHAHQCDTCKTIWFHDYATNLCLREPHKCPNQNCVEYKYERLNDPEGT